MAVPLPWGVARPPSCLAAPNAMLMSLAEGCWAACHHATGVWGCPAAAHRVYPLPCCDSQGFGDSLLQCRGISCCAQLSACLPALTRSPVPGQLLLSLLPWALSQRRHLIHPGGGTRMVQTCHCPSPEQMLDAPTCSPRAGQPSAPDLLHPEPSHYPSSPSISDGADPTLGSPSASLIPWKARSGHAETSVPACSRLCSCTRCSGEACSSAEGSAAAGSTSGSGSCTHPPASGTAP